MAEVQTQATALFGTVEIHHQAEDKYLNLENIDATSVALKNTESSGSYSTIFGYGNKNTDEPHCLTMVGKYGNAKPGKNSLFIIGDGEEQQYHNLIEVNPGKVIVDGDTQIKKLKFTQNQDWSALADGTDSTFTFKNINLLGNITHTNIENLTIKNNWIVTNSDKTTLNGPTGLIMNGSDAQGSFAIAHEHLGSNKNYVVLGHGTYNQDNDTFTFTSKNPIVVRPDSSELTDNHLMKWNATQYRIEDSGLNATNISTATNLINSSSGICSLTLKQGNATQIGNYSVVLGYGNTGTSTSCVLITGKYNEAASYSDTYFIVGNGNNTSNRSTAFYISKEHAVTNVQAQFAENTIFYKNITVKGTLTKSAGELTFTYLPVNGTPINGNLIKYNSSKGVLTDSGVSVDKISTANNLVNSQFGGIQMIGQTFTDRSDLDSDGCIAKSYYSFAVGKSTQANMCATAFGSESKATGEYSFAANANCTASGQHSTAFGIGTQALAKASFTEGWTTKVNLDATGGHAEGRDTIVSGIYAHAEGYGTKANGNYSHTEGYYTQATGNYSHAGGIQTQAIGEGCVAFGYKSSAKGYYNFVGGRSTTINDTQNGSSVYDSFAYGKNNSITSSYSAVFGHDNTTSGSGSFVAGGYSAATSYYGSAFGIYSNATTQSQFVVGQANATDSNAMFIVGNGTIQYNSETSKNEVQTRSNAFVVTKDGRATIGTNPINDMDVVPKKYLEDNYTTKTELSNMVGNIDALLIALSSGTGV